MRAMAALGLACFVWQQRGGNEIDAAMEVLSDIRAECNNAITRAVGRRLRTFLVQTFLLSLPEQRSPDCYTAWLSRSSPDMDRTERAQHLLAYSKWLPNPKKKRMRRARQKVATSTPEERRAAFELVCEVMDKVQSIC